MSDREPTKVDKFFLQLQTSERNVARHGESVQFGGGKIDPKIERDICNSVIGALCAAHGREASEFEMHLLLRPAARAGDCGEVTLAVSYSGPPAPGLKTHELRAFCQRELLDRMTDVHQTSQRIAAGEFVVAAQSTPGEVTRPSLFEGGAQKLDELVAKINAAPNRDPGQLARDTMSLQLVERLPGKVIPPMKAVTGEEPPMQIGGVKIVKAQRRAGSPEERCYFGHVNLMSLDPATVELRASEHEGDARGIVLKLNYEFKREDERFDQLLELLRLGSKARSKFVVTSVTERGVGSKRTKLTLKSWRRLDYELANRAAA